MKHLSIFACIQKILRISLLAILYSTAHAASCMKWVPLSIDDLVMVAPIIKGNPSTEKVDPECGNVGYNDNFGISDDNLTDNNQVILTETDIETEMLCWDNSYKDLYLDFNPFDATISDKSKVVDGYNRWSAVGEGRSWYFDRTYSCYDTYLNGIGEHYVCTYGITMIDDKCGGSMGGGFPF